MYLKSHADGGTAGGDLSWRTLFKYPPVPSSQGDPLCYSTHMFTKRATELIQQHALVHGSGSGAHPMFLYLALQAVHEPVEVPEVYAAPFAATIHDELRQTYAGRLRRSTNVCSTLPMRSGTVAGTAGTKVEEKKYGRHRACGTILCLWCLRTMEAG